MEFGGSNLASNKICARNASYLFDIDGSNLALNKIYARNASYLFDIDGSNLASNKFGARSTSYLFDIDGSNLASDKFCTKNALYNLETGRSSMAAYAFHIQQQQEQQHQHWDSHFTLSDQAREELEYWVQNFFKKGKLTAASTLTRKLRQALLPFVQNTAKFTSHSLDPAMPHPQLTPMCQGP